MVARHRDFMYMRSLNGAHPALAARVGQDQGSQGNSQSVPSFSATLQPTDVIDTLTSMTPAKPTNNPVPSSSPSLSPSSSPSIDTPALGLSSTPSSSPSSTPPSRSSAASSSSLALSSDAHAASSDVSSPLTVVPSTSPHAPSLTTQVVSNISYSPVSSVSPTTTTSPSGSDGTHTGAIVGGIAGTLVGLAVLGFLLMWCMRRQRGRDIDDFDSQAFKRQSVALVDDPVEPSRTYNPRPPSMIERHNTSALAPPAGYGDQNLYNNYGGYNQQSPYPPLEPIQPIGTPPPQGYGAPPMGYGGYNAPQPHVVRQPSNAGYPAYGASQQLARQLSNAEYFGRQPIPAAGYSPTAPTGAPDQSARYIDLSRSSISPYQAAQYADISRRLGSSEPSARAPHDDLPEDPLPSPFDDPADAGSSSQTAIHAPGTQGVTEPHQRPATVYGEGDAYGGI